MHFVAPLLVLLLFIVYKFLIYPVWLSPLSKIPNAHWLSPLTSLWMHWKRFQGKEVITVWEALKRKGDIVRLGPSELLVNNYEAGVRTVYGGGFEKPDWYNFFINHGTKNIFTSLGKDHTTRRRRITNIYSKTFVQESPHVRKILHTLLFQQYLPLLATAAQNETPYGILGQNLAYGLDTVSAFMVGLPRATRFIMDKSARDEWLGQYLKSHPNDYMYWLLEAQGIAAWLEKVGLHVVPKYVKEAHHALEEWALRLVDDTEEALTVMKEDARSDGCFPLVFSQLRMALTAEAAVKNPSAKDVAGTYLDQRLELASETLDQMIATRDVFGITFTYILWEISKSPSWQRKLQQELRNISHPLTLGTPYEEMIAPKNLEALPILNIIIKESMRLRGTLPVPNPRVTPYGKKTSVGPYDNIPGGVRTNSFAWCLHRNENVFAGAEEWRPERWIRKSPQVKEDMDRQFWAFGSGPRLCLGMSLAMEMIRYAIAGIYTNFSTSVIDDSTFCVNGHFVTGLPGEDLVLKFEALEPTG